MLSDIADWTPEGIGQPVLVSADTWGDHPYAWPLGMAPSLQEERNEAHWYIYWMQSMPGRDNAIPFGRSRMTNWWRFTGDWDASIRNGLGLYEPAPAACAGEISRREATTAVSALADRVEDLAGGGKLSSAKAHALKTKLEGAARLIERGQAKAAANNLRAFANQVKALVQRGRLSRADGRSLGEAAMCLSTRLRR